MDGFGIGADLGRVHCLPLAIPHSVPARFRESSAPPPAAGPPATRVGCQSAALRIPPGPACSRSSVRRDMRSGILADNFQKFAGVIVVRRAVEQSFGVALDGSQRSAQFVRDVGDEVAAGLFHALGFGEVAQHSHGAAAGHGRGGHIESAARQDGSGAGGAHASRFAGIADGTQEIGVADGLHHGERSGGVCCGTSLSMLWLAHCTRSSAPTAMTASCMLLSRVSSWRWLVSQRGEAVLQMAGGLVERGGHLADFVAEGSEMRAVKSPPAILSANCARCCKRRAVAPRLLQRHIRAADEASTAPPHARRSRVQRDPARHGSRRNHKVTSGCCDHQQEGSQQLEEDPIPHFGASKR